MRRVAARSDLHGAASLPLLQSLAHARDDTKSGAAVAALVLKSCCNLGRNNGRRVAVKLAALAVADDGPLAAHVQQHLGAHLRGA